MFSFIGKTLVLGSLSVGALGCLYGKEQIAEWFQRGKAEIATKIDEFQGLSGELRGIESRVRSLEDEIRRLKEHTIGQELEVQRIENEAAERRQAVERLKRNLGKAQELLTTSGERFVIGGATFTRAEVERDVGEKIDLCQVQLETLAQLENTLEVHRSALTLSRENVARAETLRGELTGKVRLLQAKLEKHRAREVYADAVASEFDAAGFSTDLGEVRQLCAKFEGKLEVKGRMLEERLKVAVGKPVLGIDYDKPDHATGASVGERLSKLLGSGPESAPAVVIVRGD